VDDDQFYMGIALSILERYNGSSFPNPTVVCLVVESDKNLKDSNVISFGITGKGGRPHAEHAAISKVNFKVNKYYRLYSTLEPCCHSGRDISCVELIKRKKINEVIYATTDPDKRVNGKSERVLKNSKIKVKSGVLEEQIKRNYSGYFFNRKNNRPKVTLKIALSIDGKISHKLGIRSKITNNLSHSILHSIRSNFDAILVGANTVKIDNPKLNCRLNGLEDYSPIRVAISKDLNLNSNSNIFKNCDKSKTIFFTKKVEKKKILSLEKPNLKIIQLDNKNYNLRYILKVLSSYGIFNLLVEGGSEIFNSFISSNFCDELIIFQSNYFIGDQGQPALGKVNLDLTKKKFKLKQVSILDNDTLKIYEK